MTREKTNQQDMRQERYDNFHANRQHARLSGTRITQLIGWDAHHSREVSSKNLMSRGVTFSEASRQEGSDRLREEERALADVGGESTQVVPRT